MYWLGWISQDIDQTLIFTRGQRDVQVGGYPYVTCCHTYFLDLRSYSN